MSKLRRTAIALLIFLCFSVLNCADAQTAATPQTATAAAAEKTPLEHAIHVLFAGKSFGQAVISPDGKRVAWVENVAPGRSAIYVAEVNGKGKPHRITAGSLAGFHAEDAIAWSPDSKELAFLSDVLKAGQQQLYVINAMAGRARKLTNVKGYLASPGWSPDGKNLSVLFTENAERVAGPLAAEVQQTGVIKDAVVEQRLAVVRATGGKLEQISPADIYVYEYDWSPDGKQFVVTAAHGNGDDNWYIAQIYTLPAAGGTMKSIYKPTLQVASPVWSRDGKSVAFISGLMSDEGSTGGDIFVISADGGEARNLTADMKASASWLTWAPGGQKILFGEEVDGESGFATVEPATQKIETLWHGPEQVSAGNWNTSISISTDGNTSALVRSSLEHPPEVWAGPMGAWQQVTSVNAALSPAWGQVKSIHWPNDGFNLQGWLLYPLNFDPQKKYPLVVQVHGGPGAMAHSSWPNAGSFGVPLSAAGYFVFFPNPRGSFGQGETFTRANVKDFGYGDFRDILAGVDQVLKEAPIDSHRVGITGWSYGGYMSMWAVTQTDRFTAAVAGAGIANYQSYYGENQIDKWMIPFFGASVYDDPQVYARSSPITFIKRVKTPTLVLVGDSDGECPTPQSYEFWHALKTLGAKTELVVYAHEGHAFSNPAHLRDRIERVAAWFDEYLK
jgi:dipeptidyl aminopeptidase/acylaminoacyl peptidase